jgi:thiol-disulfide isomerase/thioredoxin
MLDFWATWCGPCCASLPSMQMIKEKYADKPFVLVGMNREHAGDERKVKPFLARRNLTIQQFNDVEGKAAEAFFTTMSIPCVVIIDAAGNVADIENGYLPGKEKELMAKLEKLFAGKPVHTEEQIRALNEQMRPIKAD